MSDEGNCDSSVTCNAGSACSGVESQLRKRSEEQWERMLIEMSGESQHVHSLCRVQLTSAMPDLVEGAEAPRRDNLCNLADVAGCDARGPPRGARRSHSELWRRRATRSQEARKTGSLQRARYGQQNCARYSCAAPKARVAGFATAMHSAPSGHCFSTQRLLLSISCNSRRLYAAFIASLALIAFFATSWANTSFRLRDMLSSLRFMKSWSRCIFAGSTM